MDRNAICYRCAVLMIFIKGIIIFMIVHKMEGDLATLRDCLTALHSEVGVGVGVV